MRIVNVLWIPEVSLEGKCVSLVKETSSMGQPSPNPATEKESRRARRAAKAAKKALKKAKVLAEDPKSPTMEKETTQVVHGDCNKARAREKRVAAPRP